MKKFVLLLSFALLTACGSVRLNNGPVLENVTQGVPVPARDIEFPAVNALSEVGENMKESDLNSFEYTLLEASESKMQIAISWLGKTWEFRGNCSREKMHVWLVSGHNSIKENEPNEWVLVPPATMRFVFLNLESSWLDERDPSITCSDLKWTISE